MRGKFPSSGLRGALSIAIAAAAAPLAVHAQSPGAVESSYDDIGEIVVTAQKRTERLQDVPIAVSVLGGDAIKNQRLTQADDLVTKVPNLQLTATVGENTPIFALRGVSMSDFSLNQSGPVATYYDEVYKGNFAFLGVAMYDLERIEVLRGPQGTLYGRNTTGGAVNLISRRPENETGGYATIGYGNYDRMEATGALNVAFSESFAARVAFTYARNDGWFRNELAGEPDLSQTREYGVRTSLLWKPNERLSFLLRASTSLQNPHNYGVFSDVSPIGVGAGVYEDFGQGTSYFRDGLGKFEVESNYTPRRHARASAVALTTTVELDGGLSVTSVSSFDKGNLRFGEDTDGSPRRTLEILYTGRAEQISQDLRLASDWDGPFNFLIGAYYNREKVFNASRQEYYGDLDVDGSGSVDAADCAATFFLACVVANRFDQLKHSYAVYGDARYTIGSVTIRGGLRYTHDKGSQKDLDSNLTGIDDVVVAPLIVDVYKRFKTNNLSGKLGVDYKATDDMMLFASYSRGYRGKSFNAQAFFDPSEASIADPEKLDAFEVGAKTQFADRRATLNLSAFYYIYKNQQYTSVNPVTIATTLVNAERSHVYGGEAEFSFRATDRIGGYLGLGLLRGRIDRATLSGNDLEGKRLSNTPAVSASGGIDLTVYEADDTRLSLHPAVSYVSSQFFEVLNQPRLRQKRYALLDARIDFERDRWRASLWGKNLANKFYYTSRIDVSGFGYDYNHIGAPRTYGLTVTVDF